MYHVNPHLALQRRPDGGVVILGFSEDRGETVLSEELTEQEWARAVAEMARGSEAHIEDFQATLKKVEDLHRGYSV